MTQTLDEFIQAKRMELHQSHTYVELYSALSVTLRNSSVGESYKARRTKLSQKGHEVQVGEFPSLPPFSAENGTEVIFMATPKGKYKPQRISFYFLWDK